ETPKPLPITAKAGNVYWAGCRPLSSAETQRTLGTEASHDKQARRLRPALYLAYMAVGSEKTFYIETFGCQMNVHDSEKVIGTLISEGYRQVSTVEEAGLILYNT